LSENIVDLVRGRNGIARARPDRFGCRIRRNGEIRNQLPVMFGKQVILAKAIESVAIKNSDGSLSIPRQALRDAIQSTTDYPGIVTNYTCSSTGDCAATVAIGAFKAPNLPIEGGKGDGKPVFSETVSLADALGTSSS
jgi:hypothetical protein